MVMLVFALWLGSSIAERNLAELKDMFMNFKLQFNLDFGEHDAEREAIFRNNVRYIDETNAKNLSYRFGINQFTHLTNEEFREMTSLRGLVSRRPSALRSDRKSKQEVLMFTGHPDDLPESVDWRDEGYVTAVKDQRQCGSCWAFSATGALEGLHKKMTGNLVSLSEQELVDCSGSFGDNGCYGGLMDNAFDYVEASGLEAEVDYKYAAVDEICRAKRTKDIVKAGTISFRDVEPSLSSLKAALANNGPVSVAIEADQDIFQHYSEGVINEASCGTNLDHGVLAVGYGTTENDIPYFIVKNSWGADWGEQGYVRIGAKGSGGGICGILKQASVPTSK